MSCVPSSRTTDRAGAWPWALAFLLTALCLGGRGVAAEGATPLPAPADAGRVGLIAIDHIIDDSQVYYLRRALADAQRLGLQRVILHLTTDGGTLDAGRTMLGMLLALPPGHPQLIAYVDNRCYSAGSLVAYGCNQIFLTPTATIGDIGIIIQTPEGVEFASEKFETVVLTLLRDAAQARGWDPAKLQKMTARNQELYRFTSGGRQVFVLEDDLPQFLQDHPGIDQKTKILVSPKDRLLSYTAQDATGAGMATGLVQDLPALEARLAVSPQRIVDLAPTTVERTAWYLGGFASLFATLAVLAFMAEFKFGGHGLFLISGLVLGACFLTCQYYQELAGYPEILLMLVGVLCIVLELVVFPAAGWLLMLGVALGIFGLILAFMPDSDQFHPTETGYGGELMHALRQAVLSVVLVVVGAVLLILGLPYSPALRRLVVHKAIDATSAGAAETQGRLLGRNGVTRSELRPSGAITIDGHDWSASSEHGEFIPAGRPVVVVAMHFGEAVVRLAEAANAPGPA